MNKTIHHFRFVTRPEEESEFFGEAEGAFVCAWVDHEDEAIAEQIARDAIQEQHCQIDELEESRSSLRAEFVDDPDRKGILPRFQRDGFALTFFWWPVKKWKKSLLKRTSK